MNLGFEIASLVISILSLISTAVISFVIYYFEKKNNERTKQFNIEQEAKYFLHENADEIEFLPLCVISSCYPITTKHVRKIYNSFSLLDDKTKIEVLKRAEVDVSLINNLDWLDSKLEMINAICEKLDIGDPFLYDGFKSFKNMLAMKRCNYEKLESESFKTHSFPDYFKMRNQFKKEDGLTYDQYCEDYLYFKYDSSKDVSKYEKPNALLNVTEKFGSCDSDKLSFWVSKIIRNAICWSIRYLGFKQEKCFTSDTPIQTFEDAYFSILYDLYFLHS